jgi:hypothetical protein
MKKSKVLFFTGTGRDIHILWLEILSFFRRSELVVKTTMLFFVLLVLSHSVFSQNTDSTMITSNFGGAMAVTNNGISLIPTFSLDKPAVTFDMAMGRRKLSFEPEFQFALEGKPWGFFFWWRYKLVNTSRFFVRIGAHPALSFLTETVLTNGESKETIIAQRYLAGEFTPNYFLSKNISIGMYYLYGHGFDNEFVRNTHLLMFNINFSNIKLSNQFFISYMPQVYYLRINNNTGYNFTSTFTLASRNYPLALSAFINKTIQAGIPGSKNFIWNASLIYTFGKKYVAQ